jgi:molecular chaperone DnaK
MEQIYYTQCPTGYGLGSSGGLQAKRRTPGYPASGDFRHLGLRAFLPGTTTLAPPALRYGRDGAIAEVAWLTPRAQEYETERGPWGRPGGLFAHGLRLTPEELAALANWPAGLHDRPSWRRSDPEPTRGRPPEPLALGPSDLFLPPRFAAVAPLAAGLDAGRLARLLSALAAAAREGRTLFLIDEADRLPGLVALLTFAFPEALRAELTFSTYHDRPEELPGFRLQGTVPAARPDRGALTALGVVADLGAGTIEPRTKPARWAMALAVWLSRPRPPHEAAWDAAARAARGLNRLEPPEGLWSDTRLDELFGIRPAARTGRVDEASVDPPPARRPGDREPRGKATPWARLVETHGLGVIAGPLRRAVGVGLATVRDDRWFRTEVVDPAWAAVPLRFRLVGRRRLRWDELFFRLRDLVLIVASGDVVAFRPDWERAIAAALRDLERIPLGLHPLSVADPPTSPLGKGGCRGVGDGGDAIQTSAAVGGPSGESAPTPEPIAVAAPVPVPERAGPGSAIGPRPGDGPAVAVGIDLGTTYSLVASLDRQGRPVTVANARGDLLTPSVVLFEDDEVVVGADAVAASALEPGRIAECVKRDMGGKAYRKPINGEWLPPEVISSLILRQLRVDAEQTLGPIRHAVITVPAYFDEPRRRATADSGRLAGLEVLDILNEPTAAALAYGAKLGLLDADGTLRDQRTLTVLVYDLGGGTFDVTIVAIQGPSFRAIATDGDVFLGGKDWDEALVDLAAEDFRRRFREDPRTNPQSLQDLFLAAEACKKTLSGRPKATLVVRHLGLRHKVEVTREGFEEATLALLGRTRTTTEIVALQAGLSWSEIDVVLLVGGSTRMPMVARMLRDLTGKTPDQTASADEAVAHGAALYADLLLRKREPGDRPARFSITNVNAHSLGLASIDPATRRRVNQVLIPKNTPLPHAVSQRFQTLKPGQRSVRIRVLEGESERPEACTQVGDCILRGLPPDLPAGWPVEVCYAYEANGRLRVTGRLVDHDARVQTEFERRDLLSDEEFTLWVECLAAAEGRDPG